MQPYRDQGPAKPFAKPPQSPYARRSQYMFAGRSIDAAKGRVHNPNEPSTATGWNPVAQYRSNETLFNIENCPPSGSSHQFQYSFDDNALNMNQILDPIPFDTSTDNYYSQVFQPNCSGTRMFHPTSVDLVEVARSRHDQSNMSKESGSKKELERRVGNLDGGKNREELRFGRRESQLRLFTGSVEKVLGWYKLKTHFHLLIEVISLLVEIGGGKTSTEKNLILRDEKTGPSLSVTYHEIDRPLPALMIGSVVKCIGRLTSRNSMQAFKVVQSTEKERAESQRLVFICGLAAEEAKAYVAKK